MTRRIVRWAACAAVVLVVAWVVNAIGELTTEARSGRVERAEVRSELAQTRSDSEALAQQVRALGEEPVVEPDRDLDDDPVQTRYVPIPGPRGRDGEDGTDGEDGAPGESVPGPQGAPGEDGASVAGPPGAAGKDGESIVGPPGKDGRDGQNGADGKDGRDGRGITSIDCGADGAWRVTYSDGTTETVAGPCRVLTTPTDPIPDPPTGDPS